PTNTAIVKRLLVGRNSRPLKSILQRVEAADLASLLTQLPKLEKRRLIDALISVQKAGTVLEQIPESQLEEILEQVDDEKLARILKHSSINEGSHLLQFVDSSRHEPLLVNLSPEKKEKLLQFLNYPEDSAGRMMNSHFFSIPSNLTASQGLEQVRLKAKEESIYYIYCVGENQQLTGVVSQKNLATKDPETPLSDLAKKEVVSVPPEMPDEEVAQLVSHYDFIALPVVDKEQKIVGIITVDDVLDIIEEQATADIYATAGLQEDDRVYSSMSTKVMNRTPWMLLNLVLPGTASLVLYQFEEILGSLVILSVTKNIVTSTSGNAAIQSLTVTTRGLAVNDFQFISKRKAMIREVLVGMTMGFLTGSIAGLAIYLLKSDLDYSLTVGIVMCLSMVMTSIVACMAGTTVPVLLKNMGKDPAVGSGVIVTVITDMFGFFSFLGLATLARAYFGLV
ncbi:MAG: magnesium transporter, partial [Bdellovibrionales bacterium]|nr:magnesium transporter [Bdellovibrionales bacterium]